MSKQKSESIERIRNQRQSIKHAIGELKRLRTFLKSEVGTRLILRDIPRSDLQEAEAHTKEQLLNTLIQLAADLSINDHFQIKSN